MGTLSSTTSDLYDFYTAELDRYMHHLRGDSGDDYFERGTHGQDMPEPDEEPTDEEPTAEEPTDDLLESYYRTVYNVKPSRRAAFDAGHRHPLHQTLLSEPYDVLKNLDAVQARIDADKGKPAGPTGPAGPSPRPEDE
jgi:hypothetical protein